MESNFWIRQSHVDKDACIVVCNSILQIGIFLSKPIPAMKTGSQNLWIKKEKLFKDNNLQLSKFVREDNLQLDALTFFLFTRSSIARRHFQNFNFVPVEQKKNPSNERTTRDALQSMIRCWSSKQYESLPDQRSLSPAEIICVMRWLNAQQNSFSWKYFGSFNDKEWRRTLLCWYMCQSHEWINQISRPTHEKMPHIRKMHISNISEFVFSHSFERSPRSVHPWKVNLSATGKRPGRDPTRNLEKKGHH